MLEERKRRLDREGLSRPSASGSSRFSPGDRSRDLADGAVIRDILHRLDDRFPRRVLLWPVAVQGEGAAAQVAAAIEGFNRLEAGRQVPRPDLLIVARGGGSLEDLMAFNEEIVVRAAAASAIPLISAVGHETDTTLIDFASDRRAPTPTAAAEMAVPVRLDLVAETRRQGGAAGRRARREFRRRGSRTGLARGLPDPRLCSARSAASRRPRRAAAARDRAASRRRGKASISPPPGCGRRRWPAISAGRASVSRRSKPLGPAMARAIEGNRHALDNFAGRLATHSERHESLLARGYVVVRDAAGSVVTEAASVRPNAALELEFHDGKVGVVAGPPRPGGRCADRAAKGPAEPV